MNAPLLITSVAVLAGVAARPVNINTERRTDDVRELASSPNPDGSQKFLAHLSHKDETLNTLQLHDINDHINYGQHTQEPSLEHTSSPKLVGSDPSLPDPGLASPYVGPQHLLSIDHELGVSLLSPGSPKPDSAAVEQSDGHRGTFPPPSDLSPMLPIMILSAMGALVLLGLTVLIVYAVQLFKQAVFHDDVWHVVSKGSRSSRRDVVTSEKEKLSNPCVKLVGSGDPEKGMIAGREVPSIELPLDPSVGYDDPEVPPLPDISGPVSVRRNKDSDRMVGPTLLAWTYDNWLTHFMFALFGWMGALFGK